MNTPEVIKNSLKCHAVQWTDDGCPTKEGCEHCLLENDYHDPDELFKDALELIEELQKKVPQWISVKERLPEESGAYWVTIDCPKGRWVECDNFDAQDKEWWTTALSIPEESTEYVTHWMPLPEPPKEEV